MFKRVVSRLLERRHPWRYVSFSELSELYTSTMLRSMALSLIGIFVPIYLFKLGYELPTIFLFMAGMFGIRLIANLFAGYLIAWKGPKHVMLFSYLVQIISLVMLLTLSTYEWPLWVISSMWGLALSLYFIAYHVDFSKIMHTEHGGKELGFMTIVERAGAAAGPVVGGIIATLFGAEYTIAVAIGFFALAVVPLLLTAEPTKTHQKLNLKGLPVRALRRDAASMVALGVDHSGTISLWPLYIGVTILTVNTYAAIGFVTSLGILSAIFAAHFIGKIVDHRHGAELLNASALASSALYLVRPFIQTFSGILIVNVVKEAFTTGMTLPYIKGMYTRADELPGFRIVYIIFMETVCDASRTLFWVALWAASLLFTPISVMQWSFAVVAVLILFIRVQRFPGMRASH